MNLAQRTVKTALLTSFTLLMLLTLGMTFAALVGARTLLLGLGAAWLLAAIGLARWLGGAFGAAPAEAAALARKVGEGDLTGASAAPGDGECARLLQALAAMRAALAGSLGTLRGATDSIAAAAGQIASGNAALASSTDT